MRIFPGSRPLAGPMLVAPMLAALMLVALPAAAQFTGDP